MPAAKRRQTGREVNSVNLSQILVKALLYAAIVGTLLPWLGGTPIVTSAVAGALLGVVSWIGDATVRNWVGNALGAVADGAIAYVFLRLAPMFWPALAAAPFTAILLTAIGTGIAELFYHSTLPSPQRERV